jgi:uncharacterized protein (DUF433 family)
MLGKGVYSFPEAARFTELKPPTVREWFRKRVNGRSQRPVFESDYPPIDGDRAISFLDLVELYVVGRLRDYGLSLQKLRRLHSKMADRLGTKHPFGKRELFTDGVDLFIANADEGREELIDILRDQKVFPTVILPFLKKIKYDKMNDLAKCWRIADMVVLDPSICYGKPIVQQIGVSTAILANAYRANNENVDLVAYWYKVKPRHIMAAVEFENRYAA